MRSLSRTCCVSQPAQVQRMPKLAAAPEGGLLQREAPRGQEDQQEDQHKRQVLCPPSSLEHGHLEACGFHVGITVELALGHVF